MKIKHNIFLIFIIAFFIVGTLNIVSANDNETNNLSKYVEDANVNNYENSIDDTNIETKEIKYNNSKNEKKASKVFKRNVSNSYEFKERIDEYNNLSYSEYFINLTDNIKLEQSFTLYSKSNSYLTVYGNNYQIDCNRHLFLNVCSGNHIRIYNAHIINGDCSIIINGSSSNILGNNTFENCIHMGDYVDGDGGALLINNSNYNKIYNNKFLSNGGWWGGAISLYSSTHNNITQNSFENNSAYGDGAGSGESEGGAIYANSLYLTNITFNNFTGNSAGYYSVLAIGGSDNNISNNLLKNNYPGYGGIISASETSYITNNHIVIDKPYVDYWGNNQEIYPSLEKLVDDFMYIKNKTVFFNNTFTLYNNSITFPPYEPKLKINQIKGVVGKTTIITTDVLDQLNNKIDDGYVIYKINGITLKDTYGNNIVSKVSDGKATITYKVPKGWTKNTTEITAVFYKSKEYKEARVTEKGLFNISNGTAKIKISGMPTHENGDNIKFVVTATDSDNTPLNEGSVIIKANGVTLKNSNGQTLQSKVINGVAVIDYKIALGARVHNITAVYSNNGYNRAETTNKLTVTKGESFIRYNPITTKTTRTKINATIVDKNKKRIFANVTIGIKINGKTVTTTKAVNGIINVIVPTNYSKGTYSIIITAGETGAYKSDRVTSVIIKQ